MKKLLVLVLTLVFVLSFTVIGISCKAETTSVAEEVEDTSQEEEATSKEEAVEEEAGEETTPVKDTIIIGEAHNARSFDPAIMISGQESCINNAIYEGLSAYNKDNPSKFLPALAESWDVNEDATEWIFYLKKGVKFTTGNEMNAEDVVYSLKRGMKEDSPVYPPLKSFINAETGFEIIDDYTVKMTLDVGFGGWVGMLSRASCGILDKDELEKHVTGDDPIGSAWLNDNSIGTGPFYLKEWARNERIVLERNDNYWGIEAGYFRAPKFKTFISLNVPEPATQQMMILNGDIDFTKELPKETVESMSDNPDVKIEKSVRFIATGILMNPQFAPFSDVKVRQAVKYAIDYDTIVNNIYSAIRMDRPIMKYAVGSDDDYIYSHDLDKAKSLMAESAYPDGFDFVLNIGTGIGLGGDWETAGLKIADDLSKIGINVTLQQNEWSVQDEKLFSANYEGELNWYGPTFADAEGHLSTLGRVDSIHLGPMGWNNDELTILADLGKSETDPDKRYEIYREWSEIFAEDGPYAPIAQENGLIVFVNNVFGWDGNPDYYSSDYAVLYIE